MALIELSTVYFFSGNAPRELALKDCSFPMPDAPKGALCALYGVQGRQDGFSGAGALAKRKSLSYTIIDLIVELKQQNPLPMKSEELSQFDFLNFKRMSKALGRDVSEWLAEGLHASPDVNQRAAALVESESSMSALAQRPALLDLLLEHPAFRHLTVIAFPALTSVSDRPLNVGSVTHRHWGAIKDASCRLDPTIRITLDKPEPAAAARKGARKPT